MTPIWNARSTFIVAVLVMSACSASDENTPSQSLAAVDALFGDVLQGCGAPLTNDGAFDQRAMVAAGWQERERTTRVDTSTQAHPPGSMPALRAGEYETTAWVLPQRTGVVTVIRQDSATRQQVADMCSVAARLERGASVDTLVAAISARLGTNVAREGDQPRGGDFLTPRFDRAPHAYYWQRPQHDVYLVTHGARDVRLEVYAIADRAALDEYSPDRPERRIPLPTQQR